MHQLQPATPSDYPGIVTLTKKIDPYALYNAEGLLNHDTRVAKLGGFSRQIIKDPNDEIIAMLATWRHAISGNDELLFSLLVDPAHQGRGFPSQRF